MSGYVGLARTLLHDVIGLLGNAHVKWFGVWKP
jgi:hypothetical protein